jgi:hypothetical protein
MTDERITVYGPRFSVPGSIVERGLWTVQISYHAPGGSRSDWFHVLDGGPRAGRRMGDPSDDPVRYLVSLSERQAG